jgi:pimeloyl-ACP methyl ester carboxylesterase
VRLTAVLVVLGALVALVTGGCTTASSSSSSSSLGPETRRVRDIEVTFPSGEITLAGTLFLPDGGGRHPGVVLFHGSGPQSRDSFTGRWFAEHGVAALAYDKRGVGKSSGDFRAVPFTTLVDDGLAGAAFLKARADVNPKQIGVWGLSQGGWLGPLAASRSKDIAFVIAVSGPGVSPGEQMVFYDGNLLRDGGLADRDVEEASDLRRKVWHLLSTGEGYDASRTALERAKSRPWFGAVNEQARGLFSRSASDLVNDRALRQQDWYRSELNYDPRIALRALTVPSLFVFGDRDELVPVDLSVSIIRQTMTHPGHPAFSIVVFPGADHVLLVATSGGGRTLAPGYLDTVADWLRRTLG